MVLKTRRLICIMLITILSVTLISGCSEDKSKVTSNNEGSSEETVREIIDDANRKVKIKKDIQKVFSTSPLGTIAIYTLDPNKLAGWNNELSQKEKEYILPKYHDLPVLGGWFGKNTGNIEEILKVAPDIVISMGTISETDISLADRIQEQLNIPVILIEGEMTSLDKAYIFLGELLGDKKRAKELANYCKTTVEDVQCRAQEIPKENKLRVYYAEGPKGLETDPEGSIHTRVLEMVGGINVAKVKDKGGSGRSNVSMEQLLAWDPDVIIAWDESQGGYYEGILRDPAWADIKAVKNGQVYTIPNKPFDWFDRPPSVNRILGLKWLSNLLYPEYFPWDIRKEVKDFYKIFYHYDLNDDEIDDLLKGATRK